MVGNNDKQLSMGEDVWLCLFKRLSKRRRFTQTIESNSTNEENSLPVLCSQNGFVEP